MLLSNIIIKVITWKGNANDTFHGLINSLMTFSWLIDHGSTATVLFQY